MRKLTLLQQKHILDRLRRLKPPEGEAEARLVSRGVLDPEEEAQVARLLAELDRRAGWKFFGFVPEVFHAEAVGVVVAADSPCLNGAPHPELLERLAAAVRAGGARPIGRLPHGLVVPRGFATRLVSTLEQWDFRRAPAPALDFRSTLHEPASGVGL